MTPPIPHTLSWLAALRTPALTVDWSLAQWQLVLRLARRLRLAGRLAEAIESAGLWESVPAQPRRLLLAEQRLSRWRTGIMSWALHRVGAVLADAPYPRVLLKGGAYLGQQLPIAAGRLPSDLDILVPHAHLADAQARLAQAGWEEAALDEHDQRYYREWSHEVPPMRHEVHPIELDLHHNILPPVARTTVDADRLLAALQPCAWPAWQVFQPIDQFLHSAAHLFLDAEPRERVRDLVDLDGLARHFGAADATFWPALTARANELGLAEPLALAAHFLGQWFDTPIPPPSLQAIADRGPGTLRRAWLLPVMASLLTPADPDQLPPRSQDLAATIVLMRYHRNRLPLRLLVPHLWHKWRSERAAREAAAQAAVNAP